MASTNSYTNNYIKNEIAMDEPKLKDYHLIHGESNHLLIINGRTTKEDFQLKM